jgi:sialate O-acetylesterase
MLSLAPGAARGALKVNPLFSSNMVLQRGGLVPVWGKGDPGQAVTVTLKSEKDGGKALSKTAAATADPRGDWTVRLPALAAGGPYVMTVAGGGAAVTFNNVMVGEVWLCSGQSNMQVLLGDNVDNKEAEAATAGHFPLIRFFSVNKLGGYAGDGPAAEVGGGPWQVCSAATAKKFSAAGFFFGRALQQTTLAGVPLGLIDSSVGATRAECWISRPTLARHYGAALAGLRPGGFGFPVTGCYNGMIAPLVPYALRGVVWYQGESNCARPDQYRELLPLLIREWRAKWANPALPFLVVQLPGFGQTFDDPPSYFTELREAQLLVTRSVPNTALAVTIDLGDPKDVHPAHKRGVGERLALLARARVYGEKVAGSGPLYRGMTVAGGSVRLEFTETGGGLADKNGGALEGFEVAGADGVYQPARAAIEGDAVVVDSPKVPAPQSARYAWAGDPKADLVGATGLPASPFRTNPPPPSAKARAIWGE